MKNKKNDNPNKIVLRVLAAVFAAVGVFLIIAETVSLIREVRASERPTDQ